MSTLPGILLVVTGTLIIAAATPASAGAAFPGTNGRIAFADGPGDSEIHTANEDGSGARILTDNAVSDTDPAWSADGAKLAFSNGNAGSDRAIYTMNADGTNMTQITFDPMSETEPTWSPDGRRLAFVKESLGGESEGIYTIDADGGNPQQITGPGTWSPAWSPDGSRIAFQGGTPELGIAIYTVLPDGMDQRRVTNDSGYDRDAEPDWSPDGSKIAFTRWGLTYDVHVRASDGTGPEVNLSKRHSGISPAWSPDGSKILFVVEVDNFDIYSMNSDGSAQTPFAAGPGLQSGPSWAPGPPPLTPMQVVPIAKRPGCEIQVTARQRRLGNALTAKLARPRFPASGKFVLRVRCPQSGRVSVRGKIALQRPGKRSVRTYRLKTVTAMSVGKKWLAVKSRLQAKLARRVIRALRAGSRVSGAFEIQAVSGGGTTAATVKVRRFRR